jgi:hypothetical protein
MHAPSVSSAIQGGFWQRVALAAMFALMTSAGFGAYAGYERMVRAPAGTVIPKAPRQSLPPTLWIRSARPITDRQVSDEMGAWLTKAENVTALAAMVILGDVAGALASEF